MSPRVTECQNVVIDRLAYASRWRDVTPVAKLILASTGWLAAMLAANPQPALVLAVVFVSLALASGVNLRDYCGVLLPLLVFWGVGSLSLLFSLDVQQGEMVFLATQQALASSALLASRSLAALVVLLFLILTTPLVHLLGVLHRIGLPALLIDMMALSYRMIFVLSECAREMQVAQAARLGYASRRLALRSVASLVARMTIMVMHRAHTMEMAAQARLMGEHMRFVEATFPHARRDSILALLVAGLMLLLVWGG